MLVRAVATSTAPSASLLDVAGKVAGEHRAHPAAPGDRARAGLIVEEAVVQDGYMNALTDGYGGWRHEHLAAS